MNIEDFRNHCLSKNGVTEEFPFDETTIVFKVAGKMFALTNIDLFESISLKCDPEKALELREKYACVRGGYHLNKKHWNTIDVNADMEDNEILNWIDHSYQLVFDKLPKRVKDTLITD
ncbi:MmcQ/YjbR family DNA-binding protein [Flammeovirga sp. MY04]|uniref:MmcQ/YjbR family DNA-binding protein n=1 Tax=Flammeovirga sp. MY04 TaxID=1191459 RepID=UPI0008062B37|nr:MmcQ/YjbR family DNA-binding protein [Flammeovirga sp. MY04]ANQ49046.1 MmcQ/YjbR family DNA-binding protein [Flammeovirga sp. MY04]